VLGTSRERFVRSQQTEEQTREIYTHEEAVEFPDTPGDLREHWSPQTITQYELYLRGIMLLDETGDPTVLNFRRQYQSAHVPA
jgi:hypothetical protein